MKNSTIGLFTKYALLILPMAVIGTEALARPDASIAQTIDIPFAKMVAALEKAANTQKFSGEFHDSLMKLDRVSQTQIDVQIKNTKLRPEGTTRSLFTGDVVQLKIEDLGQSQIRVTVANESQIAGLKVQLNQDQCAKMNALTCGSVVAAVSANSALDLVLRLDTPDFSKAPQLKNYDEDDDGGIRFVFRSHPSLLDKNLPSMIDVVFEVFDEDGIMQNRLTNNF